MGGGDPRGCLVLGWNLLCNFAMYTLLRYADLNGYPRRAGFIHTVYTPDIAARKPSPQPASRWSCR